jgi:hypothetical protein
MDSGRVGNSGDNQDAGDDRQKSTLPAEFVSVQKLREVAQ